MGPLILFARGVQSLALACWYIMTPALFINLWTNPFLYLMPFFVRRTKIKTICFVFNLFVTTPLVMTACNLLPMFATVLGFVSLIHLTSLTPLLSVIFNFVPSIIIWPNIHYCWLLLWQLSLSLWLCFLLAILCQNQPQTQKNYPLLNAVFHVLMMPDCLSIYNSYWLEFCSSFSIWKSLCCSLE